MAYNSRRQRVHNAFYMADAYVTALPDEKQIKRKYSKSEIMEFFNMFQYDTELTNKYFARLTYSNELKFRPLRVTDFKEYPTDLVKRLTTDKFNAMLYLDGGYVYENFQKSKEDSVTDEMRVERAVKKIPALLKHIQEIIDKAKNPLFRNLKIEVVNKDYWLVCTYRDRGDDGNDYFGIPIYFKITFK